MGKTGSRQKYSKATQLQIIIETSTLNNHKLSEYCRRKGIYAEEIESWKKAFIQGETDEESRIKEELKESPCPSSCTSCAKKKMQAI